MRHARHAAVVQNLVEPLDRHARVLAGTDSVQALPVRDELITQKLQRAVRTPNVRTQMSGRVHDLGEARLGVQPTRGVAYFGSQPTTAPLLLLPFGQRDGKCVDPCFSNSNIKSILQSSVV